MKCILRCKFSIRYSALLCLILSTSLFLVCGFATQAFAEEEFPWEIYTPAITGMGKTGNSLPSKPINPVPADGAGDQATNAKCSWENGGLASSYDVYFGTNPTPSDFKGNQKETNYDPGTLLNDTTYYWRIDAVNAAGKKTGDVWEFSTGSTVVYQNCCLGRVCAPLSARNCQQAGGIPINAPCQPNPCNF